MNGSGNAVTAAGLRTGMQERVPIMCPSCSTPIRIDELPSSDSTGIAACRCIGYPVVEGIPIVLPHSAVVGETKITVASLRRLIRAGKTRQALEKLVRPPDIKPKKLPRLWNAVPKFMHSLRLVRDHQLLIDSWNKKFHKLRKQREPGSCIALTQHYFDYYNQAVPEIGHNFNFKFAQPRHLTTLGLLDHADIASGPSLDIGCGNGILLRHLAHRAGEAATVGVDSNFFLLWNARNRVAPKSQFVCTDVSFGLPFAAETFGTIVSSNVIQFIYAKANLIREIERTASQAAFIALTAVRHSGYKAATPNQAIPATSYRDLFSISSALFGERDILKAYLGGLQPSLDKAAELPAESVATSPLVDIVASQNPEVFREGSRFKRWPHLIGDVDVNPLYQAIPRDGGCQFKLRWPSDHYRMDNEPIAEYLPASAYVSDGDLDMLKRGEVPAGLEVVAKSGVLIDVPDNY